MAAMRRKLLHTTLRAYILFSLCVLLGSAPLFYFFTEKLFLEEADETLQLHKNEFILHAVPVMKTEDIAAWNKVNRNIKIEVASTSPTQDSAFSEFYFDSLENENEPYRVLITPVTIDHKTYLYTARINLIESDDIAKNIALLFALIVGLLLVGFFILTTQLSKKLWKPFYSTLRQIEQFEVDKTTVPVLNKTNIEEFHRLHIAINNLVERNSKIYKSQQEFIENAAHEMQTPLSVFQSKIDLIIQNPDITLDQSEAFTQLYAAASRLNKLNKNLLLLSKIENNNYDETESISVENIITDQLDFFIEQATEKQITIETKYSDTIHPEANSFLVETLISNLLLNAIKHNHNEGKINIYIEESRLIVSNTGINQSLSSEKLFQRFSKANPSTNGTGLGLAIIKRISDLYHWKIQYNHSDNFHVFIINFN
jgi:two-component system sensor histidine kinase ArlS